MSTFVLGSTGLVGNEALQAFISLPFFPSLTTLGRRAPKTISDKLTPIVNPDSTTWSTAFKAITPIPDIVISALGCTRAQAGSLAAQWEIDHDINVSVATAAKESGSKAFILVSSAGCRTWYGSRLPYGKLKNAVEDDIEKLEFDHYVVVRPGMIIGEREVPHAGQGMLTAGIKVLRSVAPGMADWIGQEADVIGRAVVAAAREIKEGKAPKGKWILEQADIVRMGRTEWKE